MVRATYCANIRRWISADLTPSAHRKRSTARCFLDGSIAQWSGHISILLFSSMWLNGGMLRAASYTSSLAHMWCCASAPLSCFYSAIWKLPLLSDSPRYMAHVIWSFRALWSLVSTQPLTEMSTRNLPGVKSGWRVGLITLPPSMSWMSENVGASTSRNRKGLHGLYRDNFTYSTFAFVVNWHMQNINSFGWRTRVVYSIM
jgi:hypothetical protein